MNEARLIDPDFMREIEISLITMTDYAKNRDGADNVVGKIMDKQEIKNNIYSARLTTCTQQEYTEYVRLYLHEIAGEFIDSGDGFRGQIALMEVKRLDEKFLPLP